MEYDLTHTWSVTLRTRGCYRPRTARTAPSSLMAWPFPVGGCGRGGWADGQADGTDPGRGAPRRIRADPGGVRCTDRRRGVRAPGDVRRGHAGGGRSDHGADGRSREAHLLRRRADLSLAAGAAEEPAQGQVLRPDPGRRPGRGGRSGEAGLRREAHQDHGDAAAPPLDRPGDALHVHQPPVRGQGRSQRHDRDRHVHRRGRRRDQDRLRRPLPLQLEPREFGPDALR